MRKRWNEVGCKNRCAVLNSTQVDGYESPPAPPRPEIQRIQAAERFFAGLGADIRHGGQRTFYRPATDHIQMPSFENFRDVVAYYSVLAHEVTHWTGAKARLDRAFRQPSVCRRRTGSGIGRGVSVCGFRVGRRAARGSCGLCRQLAQSTLRKTNGRSLPPPPKRNRRLITHRACKSRSPNWESERPIQRGNSAWTSDGWFGSGNKFADKLPQLADFDSLGALGVEVVVGVTDDSSCQS